MMATKETEEAKVDEVNEEITSKHRKERKELQAKIQALKKNAPKKKRKEVLEEIAKLEIDLEKRQAQQLNDFNIANNKNDAAKDESEKKTLGDYLSNTETQEQPQQRISKAQKRRDKKAQEAKLRENEILASKEDNKNSLKEIEMRNLQKILKDRKLVLYMIPSDGDCLYNAVKHQLEMIGHSYSVKHLREETANYIIENKDSLICYMTNPNSGDLLTDDGFIEYCDNIRNTPAWGGQIELKALSSALKVPIEVLQANAPPTIQGGNEFSPPNLTITYHRHMYSLGEHYNSTKPLTENNDDGENNDNAAFIAV